MIRKRTVSPWIVALWLAFTGTITEWDGAKQTVTVKDPAGKTTSFGWNSKTKVKGIAKLGERVTVSFSKDADGKAWASLISVDEKPAAKTKSKK